MAVTQRDGIPSACALAAEVVHLRRVITYAWRDLRRLALKGGNGADGHLWQTHRAIADKLFSESAYMHRDNRQFVSRDEYDEIANMARKRGFELVSARAAQGMSAGTAKTEGLGATPASPTPQGDEHVLITPYRSETNAE